MMTIERQETYATFTPIYANDGRRHRTDCRISHLESKDGHITIVCDEEDVDN